MIDRRSLLLGSAVLGLQGHSANAALPESAYGPEGAFSFEALTGWARDLSARPYQKPMIRDADIIEKIDFDAYQEIRFKPELAIWADGAGPFPVELFHVGRFFKEPVRIFVVSRDGMAREVLYNPDLFTFGKSSFARALAPDVGFAGFRLLTPGKPDWLAFLGAAYFRAPAETGQYGLSARGLAVDVGMPWPEEFPRFTSFWLEPMHDGAQGVTINALMDSPRITGALRFETAHDGRTVMTTQVRFFPRAPIERIGIAPLTSMFWYGKYNRKAATDWRPEIHDSDGLAIWNGAGQRIWRPINNPPGVQTSSFFDENPKGFGLLQRERDFKQYQDDGAFYNKRPSVWVEPLGGWGEGAVQLVEIPTTDETHDNIVAYWTPKAAYQPGDQHELKYRLYWQLEDPFPSALGKVAATRVGAAGRPGLETPKGALKYVVDFEGGKLSAYTKRGEVELSVSAPSGTIEGAVAYPVVGTKLWRAMFDFTANSDAPVDLQLHLKRGDEVLTETWVFQHLHSLLVI